MEQLPGPEKPTGSRGRYGLGFNRVKCPICRRRHGCTHSWEGRMTHVFRKIHCQCGEVLRVRGEPNTFYAEGEGHTDMGFRRFWPHTFQEKEELPLSQHYWIIQ